MHMRVNVHHPSPALEGQRYHKPLSYPSQHIPLFGNANVFNENSLKKKMRLLRGFFMPSPGTRIFPSPDTSGNTSLEHHQTVVAILVIQKDLFRNEE